MVDKVPRRGGDIGQAVRELGPFLVGKYPDNVK